MSNKRNRSDWPMSTITPLTNDDERKVEQQSKKKRTSTAQKFYHSIKRAEVHLENDRFYEAEQLYQTLFNRYSN